MTLFLDIEILHTLPLSNLNGDDAGLPKTVIMGGKNRARISSQSLKRAARYYHNDATTGWAGHGTTATVRTRHLLHMILDNLAATGELNDTTTARAKELFADKSPLGQLEKTTTDTPKLNVMIVVTKEELTRLTQLAADTTTPITPALITEILNTSGKRDLALYGRFFASNHRAILDGAAQVAHAFTTHSIDIEQDWFTAVDDAQNDYVTHRGAGFPGDAFYTGGTFYKYACVNLHEAAMNLALINTETGEPYPNPTPPTRTELAQQLHTIVSEFVTAFTLSLPTGKTHSTAPQTIPELLRVTVRQDRPVSGAAAFDFAVKPTAEEPVIVSSVKALKATHSSVTGFVGPPAASWLLATPTLTDVAQGELGDPTPTLHDITANLTPWCDTVAGDVTSRGCDRP